MSHFAVLNDENKVVNVIYVDNNVFPDDDLAEEHVRKHLPDFHDVVRTSYNNSIRYRYAHIGGYYLPDEDAFTIRKPYDSWVLNTEDYTWDPPVPMPTDAPEGFGYKWNENNTEWVLVEVTPPPEPEEPVGIATT